MHEERKQNNFFTRVWDATRQIPRGRVATYGMIASMVSTPRAARQVGWALHAMDKLPPKVIRTIPWHRVVNSKGYISTTCHEHTAHEQTDLLQKEGIEVKRKNNLWWVDLNKYLWHPRHNRTRINSA